MKKAFYLLAIAASLLTGACTHQIDTDYGQYLVNNQGALILPSVAKSTDYYLPPETDGHSYEFRSAMGGLANSWAIQFGRILDATMVSSDVAVAFGDVEKVESPDGAKGLLVIYNLDSYEFDDFEARVAMTVTARRGARKLLSQQYFATGTSQGGKMFWGGAFAMKNAVQQSTKSALDQILTQFVDDLKKVYRAKQPSAPDADKIVLEKDGRAVPDAERRNAS